MSADLPVHSEGHPATPAPDQADGIARAKARALCPEAKRRLRESRAARSVPVTPPVRMSTHPSDIPPDLMNDAPAPAPPADLIPAEQDLAALAAYEAATGERGSLPAMHAALAAAAAVAARPAGPVLPLQVGAKVRIDAHHPTMPAAGAVKRNHGRGGTVVQSYGQGYTDDRPRLVDLDGGRGSVLVNTLYLRELVPAPPAGPDPDALIARWQQLDEEQQRQVIDYLAQRRAAVLAAALDFEERTRPDDD